MQLASNRVALDPAPAPSEPDEVEALFVGHAPGGARAGRLSTLARAELGRLGFTEIVDRLPVGDSPAVIHSTDDALTTARLTRLEHLPLSIGSIAEFTQVFPAANATACSYVTRLAGDRAWLQSALEDFFHAGGRRAWVVVLPDDPDPITSVGRFLPALRRSVLEAPHQLRGIELIALLSNVALLCCPDLERLTIAPAVSDEAEDPPEPPPAVPKFVPLRGEPTPSPVEPLASPQPSRIPNWWERVAALVGLLVAVRPDVQLLLAAPFAATSVNGVPQIDRDAMLASTALNDDARERLVPLFPYLRSARYRLGSPSGVIAGTLAASARTRGIWRSIGGTPLRSDCLPTPLLSQVAATSLREELNVGVLLRQESGLILDDERCFSREWKNSAEVVRFVGWLRRQLTRLGETMVFLVDPDDPRPELALRGFGHELFRLGALDGAQAEDGFEVTRLDLPAADGQVGYGLRIAPAYPIDQIVLTFVHTRDRWQVEVD